MATYIALLRAVNVGANGMLPMKGLADLCSELGFRQVRTYIRSGNVLFDADGTKDVVRKTLEQALQEKMGRRIDVILRTPPELRSVLKSNPFPDAPPAKVAVLFLSDPLPAGLMDDVEGPAGEEVRAGRREIYIYYPNGMGRSRLKLPALPGPATARNVNTVAKLAEMSSNERAATGRR